MARTASVAQEILAIMARKRRAVATEQEGELRGLKRFLDQDLRPEPGRHPFMGEVVRLAAHRRISQEKLASEYRKATGCRGIQGANIGRHFESQARADGENKRRLSQRVVEAYKTIFSLSANYVGLLLALGDGEPYFAPHRLPNGMEYTVEALVEHHLRPVEVRPIFDPSVFHNAIGYLEHEAFAIECVNTSELEWERHQAFDLSLQLCPAVVEVEEVDSHELWKVDFEELRIDPRTGGFDMWFGTGISTELVVKWTTVGRLMQEKFGFALFDGLAKKSRRHLAIENLLHDTFILLRDDITAYEWSAIQSQLEAFFEKKGYPLADMRNRLYTDTDFQNWRSAFALKVDQDLLEAASRNGLL